MYEIIHVKGNTFCIDTGMTYIPFYKVNEKEIIMLDSGWAEGEQEKLNTLLDYNDFKVVGIINSHSHIDHIGNNSFLKKKYDCIIAMSTFAAHICSSVEALKLYYNRHFLSCVKEHYGHLVCETDIIIDEHQKSVYINGIKFGIFPTAGHTLGHIAIITPDDVAYLGDSLITDKVMSGTKLPYAYDLEEDLKSKMNLLNLHSKKYVIAHKGIVDNIDDLIEENIKYYKGRATTLLNLISHPMTMEEILKVIVKEWNIKIQSVNKYIVVERMLRYYVEYLFETNQVELIIDDGFLKYKPLREGSNNLEVELKVEEIVQRQLDYYNSHDLEGFISLYSKNIKIYNLLNNNIIMEGEEALRNNYKERFEVLKVNAKLKNRIVIGNKVIDEEEVRGLKVNEVVKAVAVYEIKNNLIENVWFIFE